MTEAAAAATRPRWSRARVLSVPSAAAAAWWLIGAGVLMILLFDWFGPAVAFNDDWVYGWNAAHFPRIFPASSALAIPQDAWAWLVSFGHADQRVFRASTIPFVAISAWAVSRLASRLGADRTWSALAALALVACPVFTADAATFMSDVPYLALELAWLVAAFRWIEDGRGRLFVIGLAAIVPLQRQIGIALPLAAVTAMLLVRRGRAFERRDWATALGAVAAAAAPLLAMSLAGVAPPTQHNRLVAASNQNLIYVLVALMFLPGVIGLGLGVLAPGLLRRGSLGPAALAVVLWEVFVFALAAHDVFPGNVFVPSGVNVTLGPGGKPVLYPAVLFFVVEVLAVTALAAFVLRLKSAWTGPSRLSVLLVVTAATQFAPMALVEYTIYDRYFLPVLGALLPLAALAASGATERRAWASITIAAALLLMSAAGLQDYEAWMGARDLAAAQAYRIASPLEVNAGYEENAVHGELATYDATGQYPEGLGGPTAHEFSAYGPDHPKLRVIIVGASDPRPGIPYTSLAPGKAVIEHVDAGS